MELGYLSDVWATGAEVDVEAAPGPPSAEDEHAARSVAAAATRAMRLVNARGILLTTDIALLLVVVPADPTFLQGRPGTVTAGDPAGGRA
jgi:hypothetical protein